MRFCDGNFLLAKTEVSMTTLTSSQVKDNSLALVFDQYLYDT